MPRHTKQFTPSGFDVTEDETATESRDLDAELLTREVGDEFQIVRLLGRGAMGSVYLARDLTLHRVVAIKVLRWDLVTSPDDCERFRREARTTGQLAHPNIVPLHRFGETPNVMYMVMRYVPGESLGARLRRVRRLDPDDVRRILADLALTLEYAHREGIVHRDLKPENILLEMAGDAMRPMVADFGVAMKRSYDPPPGELRRSFGTPHFMSPEQAAGEIDIDGRSDIYSLGVLGYLMLSGQLPYTGDTVQQISAQRVEAKHRPLRLAASDAPRDLIEAIERCLMPSPDDRWRHARELHAALMARQIPGSRLWRRLRRARVATRKVIGLLLEAARMNSPWPVRI
ncbi:MAG TPA: serine/threonine-protein kinase [Gemmatimonadaceae bacterium]|nr:serine/threonine-protein kinase [Gemmatimonadaceae bacterium]